MRVTHSSINEDASSSALKDMGFIEEILIGKSFGLWET